MGARVMFLTMAYVVIVAFVAACSNIKPEPKQPVVYGYAWMEKHQQELHDACVLDVIKRAPKDSSKEDLQRFLFMCLDANGQAI